MRHITEILLDEKFKPFRSVKGKLIEELGNYMDFSTMRDGGLYTCFKKDNVNIFWGLNEAGLPPTLIIDGIRQQDIDNILRQVSHEDLYTVLMNSADITGNISSNKFIKQVKIKNPSIYNTIFKNNYYENKVLLKNC